MTTRKDTWKTVYLSSTVHASQQHAIQICIFAEITSLYSPICCMLLIYSWFDLVFRGPEIVLTHAHQMQALQ